MAIKPGDTVRYLNAVGGGKVVRIENGMAIVDDDGFETPVLLRECVVVAAPAQQAKSKEAPKAQPVAPVYTEKVATPTQLPIVETRGGDIINLVIGFEAVNIKALSQSSFEAYIVNDSNYYIYVCVSTRARDDREWTLRYDGLIEPNIQEFAFEIENSELPQLDRMQVQYLAFKRGKTFAAKTPGSADLRIDATKFARLHCFRPNPYFDNPVIAYDIVSNDAAPAAMPELSAADIEAGIKAKKKEVASQARTQSQAGRFKSSKPSEETLVVDLHASELFDTTAGLSPADILNRQIDRFAEVMDANLRNIGQKIVFIHGKGEGVLRQALMKELTHRYKGHDVQDASFREYGYGATQVTIRPVLPHNNKRR